MKKIAVIGKGTGGALSAAHFFRFTDWELDWYFDPKTPTQAVGEGSNLVMPRYLWDYFNFSHVDLKHVDGSFKSGIYKEGWGKTGNEFFHDFPPPNISYHFNALAFQDYIFKKITKHNKVKIIEKNVSHEDIDADYIIDCSGKPKNMDHLSVPQFIPVNSVYVTQCYWDHAQFQHTLTIAKEHGWVFGIPLAKRCSIGYLYNNNISTLEEVKEDVKEIFERYNLTPSDKTNSFSFGNYYRKENFKQNICYNGNASFFLEPLEATSFSTITKINCFAWDVWHNKLTAAKANEEYLRILRNIEIMIMLHYFSGSKYKSKFWDYATQKGESCIEFSLKNNQEFANIMDAVLINLKTQKNNIAYDLSINPINFGTWSDFSFCQNIIGLGIEGKIKKIISLNR